jgi:hypothetical protein
MVDVDEGGRRDAGGEHADLGQRVLREDIQQSAHGSLVGCSLFHRKVTKVRSYITQPPRGAQVK